MYALMQQAKAIAKRDNLRIVYITGDSVFVYERPSEPYYFVMWDGTCGSSEIGIWSRV